MKYKRCKKISLFILVTLVYTVMIQQTNAVVIHQVLYDPIGSEAGGEAIELYNDENSSVDISNWTLKTQSQEADATLPSQTLLFPGEYYLIADTNWDTRKDDPSWRSADYEEPITLVNNDAGVALKNGSHVVDAVGWGNVSDPELVEGSSAIDVANGNVLLRTQDTDNNLQDFIESIADFTQRIPSTQRVSITIPIVNSTNTSSIMIHEITITDDLPDPGFQVLPFAGQQRVVIFTANITSNTSFALTSNLEKPSEIIALNFTHVSSDFWQANTTLNYFEESGNYTLLLEATAFSESVALNASFEYLSLLALSIDTTNISLPSVVPGSSITFLGDFNQTTLHSPTIMNLGNSDLHVGVSATSFFNGSSELPLTSMVCSLDNDFGSPLSRILDQSVQVIEARLEPGRTTPLGLEINVPASTSLGTFTGSLLITAVSTA